MPLNDWTRKFLQKPLTLLQSVSVSPPDAVNAKQRFVDVPGKLRRIEYDTGLGAASSIKMDGAFLDLFRRQNRGDVRAAAGKFKAADVDVPIGMMKLEMDSVGSDFKRDQLAGALSFKVDLASRDEMRDEMAKTAELAALRELRGGLAPFAALDSISWAEKDKIPIYFLPWQSHQLISIYLPEYTEENVVSYGRGLEIDPLSPHIFFTAAINGCSVFVTGSSRAPTVTHAGISQDATPYGGESELFWRDLLDAHNAAQNTSTNKVAEVNRTDYVAGPGDTTRLARQYKRWLDHLPTKTPMKVESVAPWGAVFGIRYGRMWSFYLQENALVKRYIVERVTKTKKEQRLVSKTNFLGRPTGIAVTEDVEIEVQEDKRSYAQINVPLRVTPFFPTGPGRVKPKASFRRVL